MGSKIKKQQDVFNAMGSMFSAIVFIGVNNATSIQPVVEVERTIFYREKAAGMYSPLPYAFAQKIPVWWRWYYWACPYAWTLYGLITSQYRDITHLMAKAGKEEPQPLGQFLESYFGFKHDFLGPVAIVIVGFVLLFAFVFAWAIKSINFQSR